jgi:hypothetical protein
VRICAATALAIVLPAFNYFLKKADLQSKIRLAMVFGA